MPRKRTLAEFAEKREEGFALRPLRKTSRPLRLNSSLVTSSLGFDTCSLRQALTLRAFGVLTLICPDNHN